MNTILLGVVMFTGVVLALVGLILVAKSKLVASGPVKILINDQNFLRYRHRVPMDVKAPGVHGCTVRQYVY